MSLSLIKMAKAKTSVLRLPLQGLRVWSLVGKLRSYMPGAVQPKKTSGSIYSQVVFKARGGWNQRGNVVQIRTEETQDWTLWCLEIGPMKRNQQMRLCRSGQERRTSSERMVPRRPSGEAPRSVQAAAFKLWQPLSAQHRMKWWWFHKLPSLIQKPSCPCQKCDGRST